MTTEPRRYARSVSQLKNYTRCGEAFYLERMVKPRLPRYPAAWTIVGNALHELYEDWELNGRDFVIAPRYAEVYDRIVAEETEKCPDLDQWVKTPNVKTTQKDIDLRRAEGEEQARLYEQHCREAEWKLWELPDGGAAVEVPFEVELWGVPVRGKIDTLLEWPDGQITVRDLKSGSKEGNDDHRQLGLYRYVAATMFDITLRRGEYFYTKPRIFGSGGWVTLDRYTDEKLAKDYQALDVGIQNNIFLANPGKACGFCGVKEYCSEFGYKKV